MRYFDRVTGLQMARSNPDAGVSVTTLGCQGSAIALSTANVRRVWGTDRALSFPALILFA
jgi:hypothetical protein